MGTFFTALGQTAAQTGSGIANARLLNEELKRRNFQDQIRKLMLDLQVSEVRERLRQAKMPAYLGSGTDTQGNVYVIEQMPDGKIQREVFPSGQKYPKFASAQQALGYALETGDKALLEQATSAIRETQRPATVSGPLQEYLDWRKSLGREPTAAELERWHRQPRGAISGIAELPEKLLRALANKWAKEGIKPPAKYQAQVEEFMEDQGIKIPTKQSPQVEGAKTSLGVLEVSLFGDPQATTPAGKQGLVDTLGVLDSKKSRIKIAPYLGDPEKHSMVMKGAMILTSGFLTDEENAYIAQFNRAVSAMNALRQVTGLPRSTQQLMMRYMRELADPVTTPNSKVARYRIDLIQREIDKAKSIIGGESQPAAPAVDQSNVPPPGANIISLDDFIKGKNP